MYLIFYVFIVCVHTWWIQSNSEQKYRKIFKVKKVHCLIPFLLQYWVKSWKVAFAFYSWALCLSKKSVICQKSVLMDFWVTVHTLCVYICTCGSLCLCRSQRCVCYVSRNCSQELKIPRHKTSWTQKARTQSKYYHRWAMHVCGLPERIKDECVRVGFLKVQCVITITGFWTTPSICNWLYKNNQLFESNPKLTALVKSYKQSSVLIVIQCLLLGGWSYKWHFKPGEIILLRESLCLNE